jgi:hypothetical protein
MLQKVTKLKDKNWVVFLSYKVGAQRIARVSKFCKFSEEYFGPQEMQKGVVFVVLKILGREMI